MPFPYVLSLALVVLGLVVLGLVLLRVLRAMRRCTAVQTRVMGRAADEAGALRGRYAEIRGALQGWRRTDAGDVPADGTIG